MHQHKGENIATVCHILISTPGRLLRFVDRTFISFEEMRFVVVDVADRMLDMGFKDKHSQNHEGNTIFDVQRNICWRNTSIGCSIHGQLYLYYNCLDVKQDIFELQSFQKRLKLMEILKNKADGTIVFVETFLHECCP